MTQECCRAGRKPIGTGLENDNQVSLLGHRELRAICKEIERRAKWSHHRGDFERTASLRRDQNRIVLSEHLTEVAGSGEVVMQAAIGDQEDLPARDLPIDHPADIYARLADDVPS